jgi:hypothetical protein
MERLLSSKSCKLHNTKNYQLVSSQLRYHVLLLNRYHSASLLLHIPSRYSPFAKEEGQNRCYYSFPHKLADLPPSSLFAGSLHMRIGQNGFQKKQVSSRFLVTGSTSLRPVASSSSSTTSFQQISSRARKKVQLRYLTPWHLHRNARCIERQAVVAPTRDYRLRALIAKRPGEYDSGVSLLTRRSWRT